MTVCQNLKTYLFLIALFILGNKCGAYEYPYEKGHFSTEQLIQVLGLDISMMEKKQSCKVRYLVFGKDLTTCEVDAENHRRNIISKFPTIAKRLKSAPLLSEDSVNQYCNSSGKPDDVSCNLELLSSQFCKQNLQNIRFATGTHLAELDCKITHANTLINKYRYNIINGKRKRGFFSSDPLLEVYVGDKPKIINELRLEYIKAKMKWTMIDYSYTTGEYWVKAYWNSSGIRKDYHVPAPDHFQVCKLISFQKKERKNAKVRPRPYIFSEDRNLPQSQHRIKGWVFNLNAVGGTITNQYSSTASVQKILFSVVSDTLKPKDRKKLGCFLLEDIPAIDPDTELPPQTDERAGAICGLLKQTHIDGGVEHYKGVALGRIKIIFSKGGIVTSAFTQNIAKGGSYQYNAKDGDVGFNCNP